MNNPNPKSISVVIISIGMLHSVAVADEPKLKVWGRDPFVLRESVPTETDPIEGLKLMGITVSFKRKSRAIINNNIVSEGSSIGRFTVKKITKDRVVVTDGTNDYELKME